MKIICVTHSDRFFVEERASLNMLEKRFPAARLKNLPPIESIPPYGQAVPYSGKLTFWHYDKDNEKLVFLKTYESVAKIQFATFNGNRLLVLCSDRLEVVNTA